MSRAYRVKVSESLRKVIRASDHVSSQLEVLKILPDEDMAVLIAAELEKQGFERDGDNCTREADGVKITVHLPTATVKVESQAAEEVELKVERSDVTYDDVGPSVEEVRARLKQQAESDLEKSADEKTGNLQKQVTDKLEAELAGIRQQLDTAVNRATAEALKIKAAQLGQIKEIQEEENGGLKIVVEV